MVKKVNNTTRQNRVKCLPLRNKIFYLLVKPSKKKKKKTFSDKVFLIALRCGDRVGQLTPVGKSPGGYSVQ